jgi:hypothetical protein
VKDDPWVPYPGDDLHDLLRAASAVYGNQHRRLANRPHRRAEHPNLVFHAAGPPVKPDLPDESKTIY